MTVWLIGKKERLVSGTVFTATCSGQTARRWTWSPVGNQPGCRSATSGHAGVRHGGENGNGYVCANFTPNPRSQENSTRTRCGARNRLLLSPCPRLLLPLPPFPRPQWAAAARSCCPAAGRLRRCWWGAAAARCWRWRPWP